MSNRTRAVVIGMLGPSISIVGILWMLARALLNSSPPTADFRYFLFDSPHLVVGIGIFLSVVCLPISIEVALARPEEVEIPVFDAEAEEAREGEREVAGEPVPGTYRLSPK